MHGLHSWPHPCMQLAPLSAEHRGGKLALQWISCNIQDGLGTDEACICLTTYVQYYDPGRYSEWSVRSRLQLLVEAGIL